MTNGDDNRWEDLPDIHKVDGFLIIILLLLSLVGAIGVIYPVYALMTIVITLVLILPHELIHKHHYNNLDSIDSDGKIRLNNSRVPFPYVIPEYDDTVVEIEDYHDNLLRPVKLISFSLLSLTGLFFILSQLSLVPSLPTEGIALTLLGSTFLHAIASIGDFSLWWQTRNYDRIRFSDEKSGQLDIPVDNRIFDRYDHDVEIRKEETENKQNIKKETNTDKNLQTETN